ncbi:MAG: iron-containing alcohol dehydrogenase [Hyphomicrobiaceae bacterium]|nr:iron-containing alcohol dehydrogenase [Hyphomicrobiaceae bacterium]
MFHSDRRRDQNDRDVIDRLIAGDYADDETGSAIGVATRSLVIADELAGRGHDLVAALGFGRRIAVVSDATTHAVLGHRVEQELGGAFDVQSIVLRADPHADTATSDAIRAEAPTVDAFVAVGSGTINDLTKYASARDEKPYAVFGTAPSMNGYTSLTASITENGHKHTLPAQAPAGAFFDLNVLAAAPKRMIRAGLGDSICRTTAQTDWLLSHLLLDTPYRQLPFDLLEAEEPELLNLAEALMGGDLGAMRVLVGTLVLSGFGTAIVGSSAPASQAEHLISHYIDMLAPADRPAILHGEQIAVTTLTSARLQEAMLAKRPHLVPDTIGQSDIAAMFGDDLAPSIWPEIAGKILSPARADELNDRFARNWDGYAERLGRTFLGAATIEKVLKRAGAPTTPEEIHLDRAFYQQAVGRARLIRNRFTVLDLLDRSGGLAGLIASV